MKTLMKLMQELVEITMMTSKEEKKLSLTSNLEMDTHMTMVKNQKRRMMMLLKRMTRLLWRKTKMMKTILQDILRILTQVKTNRVIKTARLQQ